MSKNSLRSTGAVSFGAVVGILLSTSSDSVMRAMRHFLEGGRPIGDGPFAVAIVDAYLTARLAPSRPLMHALSLGFLGFVASIAGAATMWNKLPGLGPKWYAIALIILAIPTAWIGGALRLMPLRRQT